MERSNESRELERLATFVNFPVDLDTPTPATLAKSGFIYTGHGSVIKCPICGLQIERPTRGVNFLAEHRRRSPDCRLAEELFNSSSLRSSVPSPTQPGHSTLAGISRDVTSRYSDRDRSRYFSGRPINERCLPPNFDREDPDFELLRQERCRLETFHDWPQTAQAEPSELARAGFFYTGSGDKVICAFCRNNLHKWVSGDKPMQEHRKYYPACPFVQNLEVANVKLEDQSGINFSEDHDTPTPATLAKSGFIYSDHGSVIKCPVCGLQIERPIRGVNLLAEHRRRSPNCRLAEERFNSSSLRSSVPSPTQPGHSALAGICKDVTSLYFDRDRMRYISRINVRSLPPNFDREDPDFELLRQERCRLETFYDWPQTAQADPFELARAGFFYTGTRDKVRCAFCRNYLHNWVSTDKPMQEHRRHHPACPFVQNLDVANVGLEDQSGIENNARIPPNVGSSSEGASGGGVSVYQHSFTQRSADEFMNSTIARAVLQIGFSPENVQNVVQKQLDDTGDFFSSVELLVEKLLSTGASISLGNRPPAHHSSANPSLLAKCEPPEQNDPVRTTPEAQTSHGAVGKEQQLMEENRDLKEARNCKVCMEKEMNTVFLPCGHLICCDLCSPQVRDCPLCRSCISGTVKTYLS